jgi:S1-C subfamily serine protease
MSKLAMFAAATLLAAAPAWGADDDEAAAGYLGVRLQRVDGGLAEALDVEADSGVLLSQVVDDSPAAKAGLAAGDIVVKVGDTAVGTPSELHRAIRDRKAGDVVTLSVLRDGKERKVEATLAEAKTARGPRRDRMRDRLRDVREMRLGREHGWLGVQTQPLSGDLGDYFGAKEGGALVSEVVEESPAAKLGLEAGDVIVKVDDEAIEDPVDLRRAVGRHEEPVEVQVTWLREGREQRGKVELEVREGFAFLDAPEGGLLDDFDFEWTPRVHPGMRQRAHAFGLRATEETERALDELREQVEKLQEQIRKLESKVH